ncbi:MULTISPECIES: M56 family metallopeptidase [unclassified Nocardioides]|uniref:M56 family metallopeptidase n=1 Tax=unclassified Nocardioides TaxID=2615069 RepID=UPI0009F0DCE5|nr:MULTISPECIES: M56 family metallopeptidase [unclassified Nocardioides]GAW49754.1 Peptidase family M48 [Nocardioides sp. PD653-B2]GAW56506.1 Peptidase family M48 [Nocardioides sp. PD653]
MTTPVVLFVAAAAMGWIAGYPLARARWAATTPRLAVALWHSLSFGVVSSVVLGGLALAAPMLPQMVTSGLSDLLERCAMTLRAGLAAPGSAALGLGLAGMVVGVSMLARLLACLAVVARRARRARRAQLRVLALVARRLQGDQGDRLLLLLLDDERPAAYCLPGSRARGGDTIVVSSGALDLLDDSQVRLVLAHERAHLRQRHHLATLISATLAAAFGWVPLFRLAAQHVPPLLEMAADDQAIRQSAVRSVVPSPPATAARRRLAQAVVTLATAPTPAPTAVLAAAGGSALARVHRLIQPPQRLSIARTTLLSIGVTTAFGGPLLVASAPALCAAAMQICPFVFA